MIKIYKLTIEYPLELLLNSGVVRPTSNNCSLFLPKTASRMTSFLKKLSKIDDSDVLSILLNGQRSIKAMSLGRAFNENEMLQHLEIA